MPKQPPYEDRVKQNATAGAVVGAYLGGLPASAAAQRAGIKATRQAAVNEARLKDAAPSYRKYEKVKNLADRAGTAGEGAAAQHMADKLKAKAEGERKAARKAIKGYRRTKVVARLASPKAALAAGFGGTAAAGGSLAAGLTRPDKKKKALAKRDYSRSKARWEQREKRANRVENAGQAVAGSAGAALGGAALRDAAFKDYPVMARRMQARSMSLGRKSAKVADTLLHAKPGLKTLGVAAGGTVVAAGGTRSKKIAERRLRRIERMEMSKAALAEPGALMHAADLAKSAPMSNAELARRKRVQGATSMAGSTLGLAALGSLGGAKLIPKTAKLGRTPRGQAYAKHLDRAAMNLSIGAGGIGGLSGYNFAAIQRAEAKKVARPVPPKR